MQRILIIYGSTQGQTRKIAGALAADLRYHGFEVHRVDAGLEGRQSPLGYDGVIVAASLHAGGYQPAVRRWAARYAHVLNQLPTVFVSVSLGVLEHRPETDRRLAEIAEQFCAATGWRPGLTEQVAGALAYTRYNWLLKRWMRRISRKAGGDTDMSRDYEYTDWSQVQQLAARFTARMKEASPRVAGVFTASGA